MTSKAKLTRKELNAPDEFQIKGQTWLQWALTHKAKLVAMVVVLLLVATGMWAWRHFSKRGDTVAAEAFAAAAEVMRRPVKGDLNLGADEDDERKPFDDAKARAKASLEKLQALQQKHGSAKIAQAVQLHVGNQHMTLGEPDKAIAAYEKFLAAKPTNAYFVALALENLGLAHEARKEYDKAIAQFEKLAGGKILAERGFFHQGRVFQAQGNIAKAKEAFQKSVDKAKELKIDWFAQDVEARMGLLDLE